MTKSEIIAQLEDLARDAKGRIAPEDPEDVFRRDYEALIEAVEILKEARHGKWVYGEDIDIQCSICGCDALTEGIIDKLSRIFAPHAVPRWIWRNSYDTGRSD